MRISLCFIILCSLRRGLDTLRKPHSIVLFITMKFLVREKKMQPPLLTMVATNLSSWMTIYGMKFPQSLPLSQLRATGLILSHLTAINRANPGW